VIDVLAESPSGCSALPSSREDLGVGLSWLVPVISTPKSIANPLLNLPVGRREPANQASENTILIRVLPFLASEGT